MMPAINSFALLATIAVPPECLVRAYSKLADRASA